MARRFPAPWRADKSPGGYVVRYANGQALAYVYSRENEAEALQAKMLTKDEARRIAVNVARLPELLGSWTATREPAPPLRSPGRNGRGPLSPKWRKRKIGSYLLSLVSG
jgi:hypothetical protein